MPFRHDNWRLIQIPLNKSSTKGSFERTSSVFGIQFGFRR
jgi:hypothetical protein